MQARILGLQHIGLPVASREVSRTFYEKIGFQCTESYDLEDGTKIAILRIGSCVLELYEKPGYVKRVDGPIDHFALEVKEIDKAFQEYEAAGYNIVSQGIESAPIWENGCKYFIFTGPDGERVEFHEVL